MYNLHILLLIKPTMLIIYHNPTHYVGQPTRIVIGMFYFILTIIAILLGSSYPFWIIPGLVILFVTGLGPPGSTPTVVIVKNNTKTNSSKDEYQNSNNKNRNDKNRLVIDDLMIHNSPVAVFNHLMR